jgi:hypothetical protein
MLLRQRADGFYAYFDHVRGPVGVLRRLLHRLGFDPLTVYERLRQVDTEREFWKARCQAAETFLQDGDRPPDGRDRQLVQRWVDEAHDLADVAAKEG